MDEVGRERRSNPALIRIDKRYFRPTDVVMGDASKATSKLGWESKTTFDELVSEMVEADCRAAESRSIKVKDNCFVGGKCAWSPAMPAWLGCAVGRRMSGASGQRP
ncbi:GDP-mannose 4,6-dehydratase [Mesorhizobium sp. M0977]|uniref:GDP-mannose 4,6-dehydratase n=1 Tax=Mesorhizobium sp. M0977 TaxID=2957039 RepID=UPI003337F12A